MKELLSLPLSLMADVCVAVEEKWRSYLQKPAPEVKLKVHKAARLTDSSFFSVDWCNLLMSTVEFPQFLIWSCTFTEIYCVFFWGPCSFFLRFGQLGTLLQGLWRWDADAEGHGLPGFVVTGGSTGAGEDLLPPCFRKRGGGWETMGDHGPDGMETAELGKTWKNCGGVFWVLMAVGGFLTLGASCSCFLLSCFVQNTGNQGIRKSYCSLLFLVCRTVRRGRDYNDSSGMRTVAEDAIPVSRLVWMVRNWRDWNVSTGSRAKHVLPGSLSDMLLWLFLRCCLRDVVLQSVQEDRDRGRGAHIIYTNQTCKIFKQLHWYRWEFTDLLFENLLRPVSKSLIVFHQIPQTSICGLYWLLHFVTPRCCFVELCWT